MTDLNGDKRHERINPVVYKTELARLLGSWRNVVFRRSLRLYSIIPVL